MLLSIPEASYGCLECGDLSPLWPSRLVGVASDSICFVRYLLVLDGSDGSSLIATPTSRLGQSGDKSPHSKQP